MRVEINQGALRGLELETSVKALEFSSEALLYRMRGECPVVTGKLNASLRKEVDPSEPAAYVGSDVNSSVFVELGTRKMSPRSFMRKALASLHGVLQSVWE